MPFQGLQLPQAPKIDSNFDFYTPLSQIGAGMSEQSRMKREADDAYQQILRMPGLPGAAPGPQAPEEGFLTQMGRKLGLVPPASPAAAPAGQPRFDNNTDLAANRGPNVQAWYDFAMKPADQGGLGLTHEQAVGKIANLQAESGQNIQAWGATGDRGTAHGAAQWREERFRNLQQFAASRGLDYRTTEAQQAFMRHEYLGDPKEGAGGGSERRAYDALAATRTPEEAATAVNRYYERSADRRGVREANAARLAGRLSPSVQNAQAAVPPPARSAFAATPPVPAGLQPPVQVMASKDEASPFETGELKSEPPAAQPPTDVSARSVKPPDAQAQVVSALTSNQSPQDLGISREAIASLYRNPLTRPLGQALLQKALDPGTYTFTTVGDKIIRNNSRTGRSEVVMTGLDPGKEYTIEKVTQEDGTEKLVRVKKSGPEGVVDGGGTETPTVDPSLTGEAFLAQLDPARAAEIKSIAEGRRSPPGAYAQNNPQSRKLLKDVAQYDPGFDLSLWKSREATQTDLAKGKMGQNVASFNTTLGHLGTLAKAGEDLNNTGYPWLNAPANAARAQVDPVFAAKLKKFEAAKIAVVDELTRAFRGTGGNVHDLKNWEKLISNADSPEAFKGFIEQGVDLLRSRITSVEDQYNRGMRTKATVKGEDLLTPSAKKTLKQLSGEAVSSDLKPEQQAAVDKAHKALEAGVPKAKVIEVLKKMGIKPEDAGL